MFSLFDSYKTIVIGENHKNPLHVNEEARIVRKKKPEYVLFEGLSEFSTEEILRLMEHFNDIKDAPEKIKRRKFLFETIIKTKSIPAGCDNSFLQELSNRYFDEINNGIASSAYQLGYLIEKSNRLYQILDERREYMTSKILEYSNMGRTVAIIGRSHLEKVDENLKRKGIKTKPIYLE
jgi:pheromone shutdown protein TraB